MVDGVLWLNYIAFVVFVNRLQGPLARALHLRSSFLDAFTDIGSKSARMFLEARLRRAASDPSAAHLRGEVDGPEANTAAQEVLREHDPDHPDRIFEVSVEAEIDRESSRIPSLPSTISGSEQSSHALHHSRRRTLPEACLNWVEDYEVSRQELPGVKSQFKSIVQIEISAGQLPKRSPIEEWAKAPPLRFREFAQAAVYSYRGLLEKRSQVIPVGGPSRIPNRKRGRDVGDESSDEILDEDEDVLKICEVMQAAGVWKAVWSIFRSDLANQMLSLKCADNSIERGIA